MPPSRLLRLVAAAVVTTIFSALFIRQVDAGAAVRELARLPLWAVLAAFAALAANLGFVCLRWHLLLRAAGFDVRRGRLGVALAAGTAANNVLPARAGDLLRLEAVRMEGLPAFVVAGTLFAERLLDGVVLSAWLLTGTLLLGTGGPLLLTAVALAAEAASDSRWSPSPPRGQRRVPRLPAASQASSPPASEGAYKTPPHRSSRASRPFAASERSPRPPVSGSPISVST